MQRLRPVLQELAEKLIVLWQLALCQQHATLNQDSPGRLLPALTEQALPLCHHHRRVGEGE